MPDARVRARELIGTPCPLFLDMPDISTRYLIVTCHLLTYVDNDGRVITMTAPTATPVSAKQINLIITLCEERGTDAQAVADDLFGPGFDLNTLTGGRPGTASKMITKMFSMPRTDGGGTTPQKFVPEAGVYRVGEDRIRVKFSKHGNWYASRWNPALYNPWEYIGKRIDLRDAVRLNDEEVNA